MHLVFQVTRDHFLSYPPPLSSRSLTHTNQPAHKQLNDVVFRLICSQYTCPTTMTLSSTHRSSVHLPFYYSFVLFSIHSSSIRPLPSLNTSPITNGCSHNISVTYYEVLSGNCTSQASCSSNKSLLNPIGRCYGTVRLSIYGCVSICLSYCVSVSQSLSLCH